jgi:hypothetical protein
MRIVIRIGRDEVLEFMATMVQPKPNKKDLHVPFKPKLKLSFPKKKKKTCMDFLGP